MWRRRSCGCASPAPRTRAPSSCALAASPAVEVKPAPPQAPAPNRPLLYAGAPVGRITESADVATTATLVEGGINGFGTIVQVAAGRFHSVACTADGRVLAWGFNDMGQLGLGDWIDRSAFTTVSDYQKA